MRKTIGLVGGISPESTVEYYRYIMHNYVERYEDLYLPEVIIYSVRFRQFCDWSDTGRWDLAAEGFISIGKKLEAAGADCLLLTANTMHNIVEEFAAGVSVPVISILDVVADAVQRSGISTVGLLGTRYTMELPFYRNALVKRGIDVLTPQPQERKQISDIIYNELVKGTIREESRSIYLSAMESLEKRGARGIILGCTEIPLLVGPSDSDLVMFNSTELHAEAALLFALGN